MFGIGLEMLSHCSGSPIKITGLPNVSSYFGFLQLLVIMSLIWVYVRVSQMLLNINRVFVRDLNIALDNFQDFI